MPSAPLWARMSANGIVNFKTFFEYLDIQKIRTPKGLDWLTAQYPRLTQNDLMFEMQGIRMIHCTIWTEGYGEIVSAQDADIKFIVSDHPVTVYNCAIPPDAAGNGYPREPSIALKAARRPSSRLAGIFVLSSRTSNMRKTIPLTRLRNGPSPAITVIQRCAPTPLFARASWRAMRSFA